MRTLVALAIALGLTCAAAVTLPSDAEIFVTAEDGTIVGVGRTVGGTVFELELLTGFEGFARLLVVQPGGDAEVFDVMVRDGTLFVDLVDLSHIVRDAGFDHRVFSERPRAESEPQDRPGLAGHDRGAADRADAGIGNANEIAHEHAEGAPDARAHDGAGNADGASDHEDAPTPPVDVPNDPAGGRRP